jgi:ABC-type antimicrobial peptide transport system permease subunit
LATAQINKRVKEISVKKIVGASFTHIFSQILLETIIVSLCAVLIALGLSQFFLPYLSTLIEMPLVINLYELSIWQGLGAVMLLSILISGIYPAILLANFKPMKLMKGMSFSQQNISLRKVLVVSQFAVAIIALISTLVIYQQLRFIQKKDLGYDRSMVLAINPSLFTGNWEKNFERFALYESSLRNIPELESMALTSNALVKIQSSSNGTFTWEGKDPEFKATVSKLSADEHLQEVFNLKMVAGNWFEKDKSHKDQIIINEAVIRDIGIPEPIIGRQITFQGQEKKIIGVVKDFHFKNLKEKIKPLMISYKGWGASTILARVNEKNIPAALSKTQDAFVKLFPDIPYSYSFMDETFETMHKEESKTTLLFQIFTSLLIFISCLGLFGLATFAVERRTKEIGIRKVLGANVRLIVQLLSKDFIKLVVFALIIAIPISWKIMQTWLANYAYRIEIEWWMFALAGILAIGLAFFTVSFQSIRAALINPVESLRSE